MDRKANFGAYIAIGAGVGTAMGVALDNIAVGIAIGVGAAIAIGGTQSRKGGDQG